MRRVVVELYRYRYYSYIVMQLGYVGRFAILFPVALGSALSGASVVHMFLCPELVRPANFSMGGISNLVHR